MTDDMLEVARRNAPLVAETIGHANVEFRKGRIQDLALDLEVLDQELRKTPISDANADVAADALAADLRLRKPLVNSGSIDVVVSNCVLNLVETHLKGQMFNEIFRVLKKVGRAVIYKGPFKKILDDDGHALERGKRYAVCNKTFKLYQQPPYRGHFAFIEPLNPISLEEAKVFDCSETRERHPKETKGHDYKATIDAANCGRNGNGVRCC